MSRSVHKERTEAQTQHNQKPLQTGILQAVRDIDATLISLCDRTIPQQPYLLSVPSDVPYRYYSSQFVDTWYIDTPFSKNEAQLQYMSFLLHNGEEDSLLKVVGGWADETGNLIQEDEEQQEEEEDVACSPALLSGQNTPIEQPSRKKISLKDYKVKDKTRPSTPTNKAPTQELRKQVMKSEAKEATVKGDEEKQTMRTLDRLSMKHEAHNNLKPNKPQMDGSHSPSLSVTSRRTDVPSPKKRRRLSLENATKQDVPSKQENVRDGEDSKGLPSLLSPTLPAHQKVRGHKTLPGLLLPDLPPALEKLLAKTEAKSKVESIAASRTEPVKTILNNALGSVAGKRPPERVSVQSPALGARSDSQVSVKTTVGASKVQSPAIKPALKTITRPVTPLQNGAVASPKPRQRHIIALRYGKKNRKRVEALLKLGPRLKKVKPTHDERISKPTDARPTIVKPVPEMEKSERKRIAEPSPERPVKKVKQSETPEKHRVAAVSAVKSPAHSAVTKLKPDLSTPQRELKSSAMKRVESQDTGEARTPRIEQVRTSTPTNAAASSQLKLSPGPPSSISKEERIGWQKINQKCFTLGRSLKHEGTSLGPSPGSETTEKDQALSVVLLIEALLCFMINHAAQSQARPNVDPGWSTILPYHIFVFRASRKYRHLHGLVMQLGAICRQAIHNFDIERLAREPLPSDNWESAPTPGSDGTTKQNDDAEKNKKRYISFRDQLVMNARELQSAWLEGSRYLSPTLVEREYPKTWAKRTKDTSKRGHDKLRPDAIGKEYHLPLDVCSNAFEATRFALSFLKEWSDKEKIDWKQRMEL